MSAYSVTEPFPQFHDRAGNPLEAGYIYVGVAGATPMTTPITAYWDAACTVPAAQPIRTTNGYPTNNGAAARFFVNADDFSITVNDSTNSLVFTALNAGERFPSAIITGNFDASQVNYIQGDTGSQTRTVESKLRDIVSVFDFMTPAEIAAVKAGTFLVDVTAPIAAAVASPAQEIYFPQGGYLVSNNGSSDPAIYIQPVTAGKTLRGAGRQATVIRNVGNGAAIGSDGNPIQNNTSIHICDMSLEGQPGTGQGIRFYYTSQSTIERVDCYAHGDQGISLRSCAHISLVDCWSRSNTGVALLIAEDTFFTDVRGGTFEASASGAFVGLTGPGTAPRYTTFSGCAFRNNVNSNVDVNESADTRFVGCSFQTAGTTTTHHLLVNGLTGLASSVVVEGCSLVGINGAATTVGVYAEKCEDVVVSHSVIDCTGAVAYDIKATAAQTIIADNGVIAGTRTDASTSTVIREQSGTASIWSFSDGPLQLGFDVNANAFRFRGFPLAGVNSIFEIDQWRTWVQTATGQMRIKGTDPASAGDGYSLGPGLDSYTVATLPAGAPVGYMAIVTNQLGAPVWGAAPTPGGALSCAVIHWGGGTWTVFGK